MRARPLRKARSASCLNGEIVIRTAGDTQDPLHEYRSTNGIRGEIRRS
jgi:hypothetical protein